jgi:hypothetical protein
MVPQRQGAVEGTGYVVGADWLVTNLGYREAKSLLLFRDGEEVIRTRPSPASGSCHSPLAVHGATVYAAKIAVCAILHSFVLRATNGSRMKGMREKVCARGGCAFALFRVLILRDSNISESVASPHRPKMKGYASTPRFVLYRTVSAGQRPHTDIQSRYQQHSQHDILIDARAHF